MGELRGRETEAARKRQVEQQFERRRGAMLLARIAPAHRPRVMWLTHLGAEMRRTASTRALRCWANRLEPSGSREVACNAGAALSQLSVSLATIA
jgi:hypothetical protein